MHRHERDVTSLVFGLLFVVIAALWPLHYFDLVRDRDFGVLGPLLLVGVGVAGVLASLNTAQRRLARDRSSDEGI